MDNIVHRCFLYRKRVDVTVVGGGLIGLATAWRLAQRCLSVSVWDAGRLGSEASWAGAGMLAPGGEIERWTWWGDLCLESLGLYSDFVRELTEASGLPIDYRVCGATESADTEDEWDRLSLRAFRQTQFGIAVQEAGPRTLFYPDEAAVDPRHLTAALTVACRNLGVQFHEGCPVREIAVERGRVSAPEPAGAAVLAAGAWSSAVVIRVEGTVVPIEASYPVRGHLLSFAPGSVPSGPIRRSGNTYILERTNGVAIAGSTSEDVGFRREPDPAQFQDIAQRAFRLMPELETRARLSSWIGFRPATASGEPQLGRLGDSPVYLAYGHYRNGILMAPATARYLASTVTSSSETDCSLQAARR